MLENCIILYERPSPLLLGHCIAWRLFWISFVAAVTADSFLKPWPIRMDSTYERLRIYIFGAGIESGDNRAAFHLVILV
jgi:hypothetical protein